MGNYPTLPVRGEVLLYKLSNIVMKINSYKKKKEKKGKAEKSANFKPSLAKEEV